jgi:hypothetical protein
MSNIQNDSISLLEEVKAKKRQRKLREIRKRKRILTVFNPFELRTAKRIKIENQESER